MNEKINLGDRMLLIKSEMIPTLWSNIFLDRNRESCWLHIENNIFKKIYSGLGLLT